MLCQVEMTTSSSTPSSLDWNEPVQARGRARVAAILKAARDLAIELGHLDFKMTSVAAHAQIPIGSLYQFFPTRTALLARLFFQEMAPVDRSIREALAGARSTQDVVSGVGALIRTHVELVTSNPGLLVIWSSPSMDPALQAADLENSFSNAEVICDRLTTLSPDADRDAIWETALLVCHLWGQVIRLSVLMEDRHPQNAVIDQYIDMIEGHFTKLLS